MVSPLQALHGSYRLTSSPLSHTSSCHLNHVFATKSVLPSNRQIFKYAGHISSLMQTTKRLYHLLTRVLSDLVRRYYAVEILIRAAEHGHIRVVQKMLDGGVLERTSASDGWKMIKLAVMNRHAAVVDQLQQNDIKDITRYSQV